LEDRQEAENTLTRKASFAEKSNVKKTFSELQEKRLELLARNDIFFPWECVSIFMDSQITLDFVVRDNHQLMAILRILHNYIYKVEDPHDYKVALQNYIWIKYKNKLAYHSWAAKISIPIQFMQAILKSLDEMKLYDLTKVRELAEDMHSYELQMTLKTAAKSFKPKLENGVCQWSLSLLPNGNVDFFKSFIVRKRVYDNYAKKIRSIN
jgi:hypothetical protein